MIESDSEGDTKSWHWSSEVNKHSLPVTEMLERTRHSYWVAEMVPETRSDQRAKCSDSEEGKGFPVVPSLNKGFKWISHGLELEEFRGKARTLGTEGI